MSSNISRFLDYDIDSLFKLNNPGLSGGADLVTKAFKGLGGSSFFPSQEAIDASFANLNGMNFYNANNNVADLNAPGMGYQMNAAVRGTDTKKNSTWGLDEWAELGGFATDLIGAYTNWKGLGLAEDAFAHQMRLDKTNMANQVASMQDTLRQRNDRQAAAMGRSADPIPTFRTLGA